MGNIVIISKKLLLISLLVISNINNINSTDYYCKNCNNTNNNGCQTDITPGNSQELDDHGDKLTGIDSNVNSNAEISNAFARAEAETQTKNEKHTSNKLFNNKYTNLNNHKDADVNSKNNNLLNKTVSEYFNDNNNDDLKLHRVNHLHVSDNNKLILPNNNPLSKLSKNKQSKITSNIESYLGNNSTNNYSGLQKKSNNTFPEILYIKSLEQIKTINADTLFLFHSNIYNITKLIVTNKLNKSNGIKILNATIAKFINLIFAKDDDEFLVYKATFLNSLIRTCNFYDCKLLLDILKHKYVQQYLSENIRPSYSIDYDLLCQQLNDAYDHAEQQTINELYNNIGRICDNEATTIIQSIINNEANSDVDNIIDCYKLEKDLKEKLGNLYNENIENNLIQLNEYQCCKRLISELVIFTAFDNKSFAQFFYNISCNSNGKQQEAINEFTSLMINNFLDNYLKYDVDYKSNDGKMVYKINYLDLILQDEDVKDTLERDVTDSNVDVQNIINIFKNYGKHKLQIINKYMYNNCDKLSEQSKLIQSINSIIKSLQSLKISNNNDSNISQHNSSNTFIFENKNNKSKDNNINSSTIKINSNQINSKLASNSNLDSNYFIVFLNAAIQYKTTQAFKTLFETYNTLEMVQVFLKFIKGCKQNPQHTLNSEPVKNIIINFLYSDELNDTNIFKQNAEEIINTIIT